jgi:bifunctional UDP-N-acetylglucosamine pyrophosphorylase / glucosamine-1-phosphate N-acetyltransferase
MLNPLRSGFGLPQWVQEIIRSPPVFPRRSVVIGNSTSVAQSTSLFAAIAKATRASDNNYVLNSPGINSTETMVAVVLAAGKGTRLRSDVAKVLHRAGGRSLVEHVVRACQPLNPSDIFVVVGHQADKVRAVIGPLAAKAVLQEPQRGTGHAMQVARAAIGQAAKYALIVPGDAPLIRATTLAQLVQTHASGRAAATILSAILDDPTGYGRIVRKPDGTVAAIVEEKSATPEQKKIREINSSAYCITLEKLWPALNDVRPDNVHRELYLTDAIGLLNERGQKVLAFAAEAQEVLGCNTRAELAEVDRLFRRRKAAELMDAGVTIYLPETVVIDPDVEIGQDTVIESGVQLLGHTRIGAHCLVRTGSILLDTMLDDNVVVEPHCVLQASRVAEWASVGPFSRLRPGADVREGAHVGNFVELKNSVLGEGAKAQHLTYLGDADVGPRSNIGAGTITCNYDGVKKHRTTIGAQVFIGSDTALVAPVEVGDRAYVAAGSVITENVPPDALGIARSRQSNKEGWVAQHRTKVEAAGSARTYPVQPQPAANQNPRKAARAPSSKPRSPKAPKRPLLAGTRKPARHD